MCSESFAWASWAPQGGKAQPGRAQLLFPRGDLRWKRGHSELSRALLQSPLHSTCGVSRPAGIPSLRGARRPRISEHSYLASVCQQLVLIWVPFLPVSQKIMQHPREHTKPHTQFCGKWFCFHQRVFFANTLLTFLHCVHVSHPLLSPFLSFSSSLSEPESPHLPIL